MGGGGYLFSTFCHILHTRTAWLILQAKECVPSFQITGSPCCKPHRTCLPSPFYTERLFIAKIGHCLSPLWISTANLLN